MPATNEPESDFGNWTMVVAAAHNGVIGRGDALPWKLSSDLQRFKRMTMGHCLLMGRKTYEAIGRPLPGRQTIVLSRGKGRQEGSREKQMSLDPCISSAVTIVAHLSDVESHVEPGRRIMVVGGAEVYRSAIDYCSTIWLTRVQADVEGDTYFPEIDWSQWQRQSSESVDSGPRDQWPTEFQIWTRRAGP